MPVLPIARMGNPVLRKIAEPIADPTDPAVARLAADMIATMLDAPGVGLAAPQIAESRRIIVFRVPADRGEGEEVANTVLVNPVIEPLTDDMVMGWEGCLSIPGLRGLVPRFARIRYRGYGLDGARIEREASGFHPVWSSTRSTTWMACSILIAWTICGSSSAPRRCITSTPRWPRRRISRPRQARPRTRRPRPKGERREIWR